MRIIVTDLTRFKNRDKVCLAGINPENGQCIRPMQQQGTRKDYYSFESVKGHGVVPGSFLEGDFVPDPTASPPHSEDHVVDGKVNVVGAASGREFESVLEVSSTKTIRSGFGVAPIGRRYPLGYSPSKSIITLKVDSPRHQFQIVVDDKYGPPKFKAHVTDADGLCLRFLPVTDLGFYDHIGTVVGSGSGLSDLNSFVWAQEVVYLRVGLSRLWGNTDDDQGYWMQLNGIYSFPDFKGDFRIYE